MKANLMYGNYIKNQYILPNERTFIKSINPADYNDLIGQFVLSTHQDVDQAVSAAVESADEWSKTPGPERAKLIQKAVDGLAEHKDQLARLMTREQGKPYAESLGEIGKSIAESGFMIGEGYRMYGETVPSERKNTWTLTKRVPVGPVAAITPWNFPVLTLMRKIIPGLIAGNPIVLKPSEFTPLTGLRLIEILSHHLPSGVLNAVTGDHTTGQFLVNHPKIKAISFTGSVVAGRLINEAAAKRFARVQAEMGGKNPAVIWDPIDMQDAVQQISSAAFLCSGQRCTAISRVIVAKHDAAKVEQALLDTIANIQPGNGMNDGVGLGPLISQSHGEKVQSLVDRAVSQGARVLCGGKRLAGDEYDKGFFYPITLLTDVTSDMEIAREEVFGPVLCIQSVKTFNEALVLANDVDFGLTAALFSRQLDLTGQFVDGIESGMVHVNHGSTPELHMPFVGVKESGVGVGSVGASTIDFFTTTKSVYVKYTLE